MTDRRPSAPSGLDRDRLLARTVRDRVRAGADIVDLVALLRAHPVAVVERLDRVGALDVVPGAPQPGDTPAVRRNNHTWLALLAGTVDDDDARLALLSRHCDKDPDERNWRVWLTSRGLIGRDQPRQYYRDRAWCAVQVARGRSRSQIATAAGSTHPARIVEALAEHGLAVPAPARRARLRPAELDDRAWLAVAVAEKSRSAIASELDVSFGTVQRALDRFGIVADNHRPPGRTVDYPELHDPAWLRRRAAEGATRLDVAGELGCAESTVAVACRRAEVAMPTGRDRVGRPKQFPELDNATLLRAELDRRVAAQAAAGDVDPAGVVDELAGDIGCRPETLRAACRDHGIPIPRPRHPGTCPQLTDRTWLAAHSHLTPAQAARELGCHVGQVYRAAQRFGIELADGRAVTRGNPTLADPDAIAAVLDDVADHPSPRQEAARRIGCHVDTLRKACRAAGLELPPSGRKGRRTYPQLHQPAWLQAQADAGRSTSEVADEIGCTVAAVQSAMRQHGITGWRSRGSYPQLSERDTVRGWVDAGGVAEVVRQVGCAYPTAWRAARTHAADLLDADLDEDRLVELWHEHGSQARVARELGVSPSTVQRVLTVRGELAVDPDRVAHPKLADRDWLAEQVERGRTAAAIGRELGVAAGSVRTMMSRFGLRSHRRGRRPRFEQLADRDWLADRAAGSTARRIADEVGCSTSAVYAALRRHGLASLSDDTTATSEQEAA